MTNYRIVAKSGVDHGIFQGETKSHALSQLHQMAGYRVTWDPEVDQLVFSDPEDEEICGLVEDWEIEVV